jgi:hypothetical protein
MLCSTQSIEQLESLTSTSYLGSSPLKEKQHEALNVIMQPLSKTHSSLLYCVDMKIGGREEDANYLQRAGNIRTR